MSDADYEVPITLVVLCLCVAAAIVFGLYRGEVIMQEKAVAAGHAEWVASTNGKPQFKWKEAKP